MREDETTKELARIRAEHRQVSDLLALIQELTSSVVRAESAADLFERAFATLSSCISCDVAVAVMLEQNLDLYVSTREDAAALVNEQLVARIRERLGQAIPVSFASTEVVVRSEVRGLPAARGSPTGLEQDVWTLLQQDRRTAGLLLLCRADPPFSPSEQQILTIFSTQVSLLLDMIHARERIANLADTDELTGVWNRRYFRRQLAWECERARTFGVPLSLLLFDIDEFKQINDGFGHGIGDVVLSELCGVVREALRPTDTLARFGGDEFAVILPHTDRARAVTVAERLLGRVGRLTIPTDEEGAIRCSVSIGLVEYGNEDKGATELIRRADELLYEAKRQGKNRYSG